MWLVLLPAILLTAQAPAGTAPISEGFTVSESGQGWTLECEYPPIETALSWMRAEVMEDVRETAADFIAFAEDDYAVCRAIRSGATGSWRDARP
jgi:hypothetical protein